MKLFPIYTWNKGLNRVKNGGINFINLPWAQGVVLLVCVAIAMLLANLSFTKELYKGFLETSLTIHIHSEHHDIWFPRGMTVEKFINDILMVVFFFTVGLEIKREAVCGELSSVKKALLPVIAAFGGVIAPALIFASINHGTAAASGWGIPTATDIAFAVGIISILGDKVPISLKVFLTALAIADDLVAILVVALFYGGSVNLGLLAIAGVLILVILIINKLGEKRLAVYLTLATALWILFYYAGIHSTMAGVVMAFLTPMNPRYHKAYLRRNLRLNEKKLRQLNEDCCDDDFPNEEQRHCLRNIADSARNSIGLSYQAEHALGNWVNFLIMPIFALANAGVEITDPSYFNIFHFDSTLGSVSLGVFLGLLLGKPIGITLASVAAIKSGACEKPNKASWAMLFAVACLGGIGFTMSIFVDTLSFGDQTPEIMDHLRNAGKIAVLLGSLCSGILGSIFISFIHKIEAKKA